jgi:uncharacterized protein (DUF2267 family)
MDYRHMIKTVQDYSGFSDNEAGEALRLVVETIAGRLTEGEREDFASQLPGRLHDFALAAEGSDIDSSEDLYEELAELEDISREHAKKQVHAVWETLKESLSKGEIDHIRSQLPGELVAELH